MAHLCTSFQSASWFPFSRSVSHLSPNLVRQLAGVVRRSTGAERLDVVRGDQRRAGRGGQQVGRHRQACRWLGTGHACGSRRVDHRLPVQAHAPRRRGASDLSVQKAQC
jgi:hypothetical protein